MCRSQAEGGQRCAAHTRSAYESAEFGSAEWDKAAAEYASTPTGMVAISGEWFRARAEAKSCQGRLTLRGRVRDENRAAYRQVMDKLAALEAAMDRGEQIREANQATANAVRSRRGLADKKPQSRREHNAAARERQATAEEVVWCLNHGYLADAQAAVKTFESRFGDPEPGRTAPPRSLPSSQPNKQTAARKAQAEEVVYLMTNGWQADAKHAARTFAAKFDGGYDPNMAQEMTAYRTRVPKRGTD